MVRCAKVRLVQKWVCVFGSFEPIFMFKHSIQHDFQFLIECSNFQVSILSRSINSVTNFSPILPLYCAQFNQKFLCKLAFLNRFLWFLVYSVPILNEYEEYIFTFHLSTLILKISMKNHIIPCWTASRTVKYECCHCHILHFSFHFLQIVHNVTLSPYHYKAVFITFCTILAK